MRWIKQSDFCFLCGVSGITQSHHNFAQQYFVCSPPHQIESLLYDVPIVLNNLPLPGPNNFPRRVVWFQVLRMDSETLNGISLSGIINQFINIPHQVYSSLTLTLPFPNSP